MSSHALFRERGRARVTMSLDATRPRGPRRRQARVGTRGGKETEGTFVGDKGIHRAVSVADTGGHTAHPNHPGRPPERILADHLPPLPTIVGAGRRGAHCPVPNQAPRRRRADPTVFFRTLRPCLIWQMSFWFSGGPRGPRSVKRTKLTAGNADAVNTLDGAGSALCLCRLGKGAPSRALPCQAPSARERRQRSRGRQSATTRRTSKHGCRCNWGGGPDIVRRRHMPPRSGVLVATVSDILGGADGFGPQRRMPRSTTSWTSCARSHRLIPGAANCGVPDSAGRQCCHPRSHIG